MKYFAVDKVRILSLEFQSSIAHPVQSKQKELKGFFSVKDTTCGPGANSIAVRCRRVTPLQPPALPVGSTIPPSRCSSRPIAGPLHSHVPDIDCQEDLLHDRLVS